MNPITILVAVGTLWAGMAVADLLTLARSEPINKATSGQPGQQPVAARKARNPLGAEAAAERQGAAASQSKGGRPACPQGWADFQNPVIGMQAHVPADYWVRLRGGLMLSVEKQDTPATAAFLVAAFLRRIVQGNQQAADKIRETYDYMNQVDNQIRKSHWDTMDAIAEMNYDTLREHGGYVNEKTGRIEQIPPESVVKNSRGERVSLEEVRRGVDREQATVLRDAFSNDYMRGVYGRAVFSY